MSDEPKPDGVKRNRLETVTYPKPRCPLCGSADFKKNRSIRNQGDGSSISWVKCRQASCGHRFKVLLE